MLGKLGTYYLNVYYVPKMLLKLKRCMLMAQKDVYLMLQGKVPFGTFISERKKNQVWLTLVLKASPSSVLDVIVNLQTMERNLGLRQHRVVSLITTLVLGCWLLLACFKRIMRQA